MSSYVRLEWTVLTTAASGEKMETLTVTFDRLRTLLDWAPDVLVAIIILGSAAFFAILFYAALQFVLRRTLSSKRHTHLQAFLVETRSVTLMGVLVLATAIALPAAPLAASTTTAIEKALLVAIVVLIGWAALTAVRMTSKLYLMRFHLETEDNLLARKHITQVRILRRAAETLIVTVTIAAALMTFEPVRHYGISLFASAGVAGLVVGFAARPLLSNLIAGIQIATTQPIRIDDAVVVENESGRVEDITSTYVVIRLWDQRRLIVPLTYFIEKPFQNWTREQASLIGTVLIYVDYTAPVERVRAKALEFVKASKFWDGNLASLQVTDARETSIELRVLASARSSGETFDLRCEVREKLIDFLQKEIPSSLPRVREMATVPDRPAPPAPDRAPETKRPVETKKRPPARPTR
jgi:small-conductance mechanosensitive channel